MIDTTPLDTRPALPSRTNEVARRIAKSIGPLTRPLAGRRGFGLWAIIHYRGRRSGREYATPIAIVATPESFVIPLPFGERADWCRNVRAAGGCVIRWKGADHHAVDPEIIDGPSAAPAFNAIARLVIGVTGMDAFLRLRRT